jgi:hypothetical protein
MRSVIVCIGAVFLPRFGQRGRADFVRRNFLDRRRRDPTNALRASRPDRRQNRSLKFFPDTADDEKGESRLKRRFPLVDLSESPYSPEARETRRSSANVGKNRIEASSNAPCAPENQWGGDVYIMAAKKKTAKKTAKSKKK